MKLPNGDRAIVPDHKLFGYLLNEAHESQAGHAELFRRLLGVAVENGELLRTALLTAAATREATLGAPSPYGGEYDVRRVMNGRRQVLTIMSGWICETGNT